MWYIFLYMWKAIIEVILRVIKSKALSLTKISIKGLKKFKTISKWVRDWKTQKALLLEEIKRQKEILLKGSMKDRMKEFASDWFITKFIVYKDIQKDIKKSEYKKQRAKVDFVFEFPILRKHKVLKHIWKEHLRLKKKYKDFLDKFERQIQREIRSQNKKQYQEFLKQDKASRARIREFERYQKQNQLLMEQEQKRLLRELEKNTKLLNQTLKTLSKEENNKNLLNKEQDINTFWDFTNTLSTNEREFFINEIFNKSNVLEVKFNSSWIAMGIFIPHFKQREYSSQLNEDIEKKVLNSNTRGYMKLKLKKGSKRNPSGVYMWWNVKYGDWKKIIHDKTGKNFWIVWYKRNRKNMMYLLPNSKYWNNVKKYKSRNKAIKEQRTKQISVVGRKQGLATGLNYSRFRSIKKRKKKNKV